MIFDKRNKVINHFTNNWFKFNDYTVRIKDESSGFSPTVLCNYIFELVKEFNNFYQTVDILREEDKNKLAFRLQLAEDVGRVIRSGMSLLGINVPNKI